MAMRDRLRRLWARRKVTPSEELGKDGPLTAMVIVAHPDDAEFMCAGTAAKWSSEGWTVYYVLVTSGDKGTHDPALTHQELAAVREQEQREACKILGVKEVFFLGYPDGFVEPTMELRGEVVRLLREYRPDVVITWDGFRPGFNHNDHRNVGIAVRDAIYPAVRDHLYYPEHNADGLEPHQVNEMLLGGTDEPDYHIDISAHMDTKLQALAAHSSQMGGRSVEDLRKMWEGRMRNAGRQFMSESFKRVSIRRSMRQTGQEQPAAEQPPAAGQDQQTDGAVRDEAGEAMAEPEKVRTA